METEQGKILEALQIAIQMETDGKKYYLKASQKSSNELGRKLLQSLAIEEDSHRQELEEISPAIQEAKGLAIAASGPFPADSIFNRALSGEFDVVLAMYHDQGHIPIKVHGFERSVSVALGLPFVRTSVDHGTAFDIVGKGTANPQSLEEAIKLAVRLSEERRL